MRCTRFVAIFTITHQFLEIQVRGFTGFLFKQVRMRYHCHNNNAVQTVSITKKCLWLRSPTHPPIQKQWWSKVRTQKPHSLQCLVRRGCKMQHVRHQCKGTWISPSVVTTSASPWSSSGIWALDSSGARYPGLFAQVTVSHHAEAPRQANMARHGAPRSGFSTHRLSSDLGTANNVKTMQTWQKAPTHHATVLTSLTCSGISTGHK
mmetsp:Transcript_100446/g.199417  ORF Transcript_100446/g.199417 Transcript_100446/m.199417 type:complete len:206 (-) Transcript_100446:188-805(-)